MAAKIPFRASRVKIARAAEHLETLNNDVAAFMARKPIVLKIRQDAHPDYLQWALHSLEAPPDRWSAILGDIVHNLRTSLDLLAGELVRMNGQSDKGVYFPFCEKESELEDMMKRRNFNASDAAKDLVRKLKPYKFGNTAIRYIHDLDIMDKHQMLFPAFSKTNFPGGAVGHALLFVGARALTEGTSRKEFAKVEGVDCMQTPLPDIEVPTVFKLVFPFHGPMADIEMLPALGDLINYFSGILDAFEAIGGVVVLDPRIG